jgi:tetratricopeptide (TPR) repeat protein
MASSGVFVGRKEELREFTKVLEDLRGQAVIVVGNRGMGKTWLVNKMAKLAGEHPPLKCGCVRYEVTENERPDSTMEIMMDNAFEAGQVKEGSFDGTKRGLEQWRSFWNVFNLGDLILSLRRELTKDTRQQFLERLGLISKRMPENGRAIFIIDPEKYMADKSDQDWAIVIKSLPEKIKFIFAQRTEDALVDSEVIDGLDNVVWIPSKMLDSLSEEDVDELLNCRQVNLRVEISELKKVLNRYKGHPYAVGAALDLVEQETKLEELPKKAEPIKFAEVQWKKVCNENGKEANRLFKAYAILEVSVPDDVVKAVSKIDGDTMQCFLANKFVAGLLREEAGGKRIYHSILADYILGQISEAEKKEYHKRAVEVYRGKLKKAEETQTKPDELAAMRLPGHVLVAEGIKAFVDVFGNVCFKPLHSLGLLDEAISLSKHALEVVEKDSIEQALILGNLGIIYRTRSNLDKAEEVTKKALDISEKHNCLDGMSTYYCNLGVIYGMRGKLYEAKEMYKRSLEIDKKLGNFEGMSRVYDNIGLIHQKEGDLDKAEEMIKKALDISEKYNWLELMAIQYGNLGLNYLMRERNPNKAEEMIRKSLDIHKKFGRLEGMARQYGHLGVIYQMRGDLEKAEELHKKAFEIDKNLGRLDRMARDYTGLGNIYNKRGDSPKAKEYFEKARDLFKRIEMPNEMEKMEEWIKSIGG